MALTRLDKHITRRNVCIIMRRHEGYFVCLTSCAREHLGLEAI